MSTPSHPPAPPSPVELEPVTCWPLIFGAIGFVCLGLLTVTGLVAWSALFPPPKPAAVVEAPTPEPAPEHTQPIDVPAPAEAGIDNERQVKKHREVVGWYNPLPPVSREVVESSRARPQVRRTAYCPPRERVPTFAKPIERSEAELAKMLWTGTTLIDLETERGAGKKVFDESKKHMELRRDNKAASPLTKHIADLLKSRPDLTGLPMQNEKDCQSSKEAAKTLASVSARVRRLQAIAERAGGRFPPPTPMVRDEGELTQFLRKTAWTHAEVPTIVRPLEQIFQTETREVRRDFIETLAAIKGREATAALARRAVFDLSPLVRADAIKALAKRSFDDARPIFLAALRHPWAPAADHAAVALSALNDQKAFESIKELVDAPDPSEPFKEDKKWYVREVVRVNHLRNCLLCHPASVSVSEPLIAPIPEPGKPLPAVYAGRSRFPSIRADIVYFRQDFSAVHQVDKPDKWPEYQRFDYMVRKRQLTAREVDRLFAEPGTDKLVARASYPQREAVLYTLYQLAFVKDRKAKASR